MAYNSNNTTHSLEPAEFTIGPMVICGPKVAHGLVNIISYHPAHVILIRLKYSLPSCTINCALFTFL